MNHKIDIFLEIPDSMPDVRDLNMGGNVHDA